MKYLIISSIVIFGNIISYSQADSVWTLRECIERAQDENISLQISQLDVRSAEINETRTQHSRWPSLNASSNFGYNFGRTIDPTSNEFIATSLGFQSISLNAGATLFNANRVNNNIHQARIDKEISQLNFEQAKRDIALQVANLYLNALLAKENLNIAIAQFDNAKKQAERSKILVDQGAQPRATLLEFEAEAASREQSVIQSENNLRIAYLQLKQALRLKATEAFDISSPPTDVPLNEVQFEKTESLYRKALNTFPSYSAAQRGIHSAQLGKKIASASFYPSLSIGANLNSNYSTEGRTLEGVQSTTTMVPASFNGENGTLVFMSQNPVFSEAGWFQQIDENLGYGAGLQLSIPIYNNYAASANYQLARLAEIRAERQLSLEEQNIRIDLEQAIADRKAAQKSYAASERAYEAAQLAYQNVSKQYEIGAISVYDLFESEQRRDNAQLQMVLAKYNFIFAQKVVEFYSGQEMKL